MIISLPNPTDDQSPDWIYMSDKIVHNNQHKWHCGVYNTFMSCLNTIIIVDVRTRGATFLVVGLVVAVGCGLSSARVGVYHTNLQDTTYTNKQQCRSTHPLTYSFTYVITCSFTQSNTNTHSPNQTHKNTRMHINTYVHSFLEPTHIPTRHITIHRTMRPRQQ